MEPVMKEDEEFFIFPGFVMAGSQEEIGQTDKIKDIHPDQASHT